MNLKLYLSIKNSAMSNEKTIIPCDDDICFMTRSETVFSLNTRSVILQLLIAYTYHVHLARDAVLPVVPEHGDAADADGYRPRGAHQQPRHQLRHVAAIMQWVHYRYIPENHQIIFYRRK